MSQTATLEKPTPTSENLGQLAIRLGLYTLKGSTYMAPIVK